MDFRLLGAIEVGGQAAPLRRQERSLLAILLLRANESVPLAELVDLLWPDDPPADARGSLQVYLSRLRKALPGITITSTAAGYAVQVAPDSIDVERFRRQLASARKESDPVLRADGLRRALDLWHGDPLADLTPQATRDRLTAGLVEEHASAVEDRVDADLQAGRHAEVEAELAGLVRQHPERERLMLAWMTALYRSGRKPEALQAYVDGAMRLAEEFGLDPAPALRRLHLAILRDDPSLRLSAMPRAESAVPRELPVDISLLVGRDDLLADVVRVLTTPARQRPAVYCLWGGAGVGKSAAATRSAHLVAEQFPDGQLLARLQDVGGEGLPARTLLGRMLRSLGLEHSQVPATLADREQAFRELTADRAVLVVLDDALDAETVTSLLPAGARCAAIVTSRKPLPELTDAVHRQVLPLDPLTSRGLLARLIGRTLREQSTLAAVADECAGLPLALRIIGSRLALSGDDALPQLAGALADDDQRLDSMVAGDLAVRTSLGRTLALADPDARDLLARLSLVGVTEFPSWVAAPLLDCDESAGAAIFDRLVDLGLVELVTEQRYKMHALVRAYAAEQLAAATGADESLRRYLEAVYKLEVLADSNAAHGVTLAAALPDPDHPVLPETEASILADPMAWFEQSWPLIDAAVAACLGTGRIELAAWLGLRINGFYVVSDQREQRIGMLEAIRDALRGDDAIEPAFRGSNAIEPALRGSDAIEPALRRSDAIELALRVDLGLIPAYEGSAAELLAMSERVVTQARAIESVELQVRGLIQVANHARHDLRLDRDREALEEALELIDHRAGPAELRPAVVRNLASNSAERHDYASADRWYREVLEVVPSDTMHEIYALILSSEVLVESGQYDEAAARLTRCREVCRLLRSGFFEAQVDCLLASMAIKQGDLAEARRLLDVARTWFEKSPRVRVAVLMGAYESDLAMALGDFWTGRRIRLELIEDARQRGDRLVEHQIRYLLDNDDRDPLNPARRA
ncbi:BTAD domain-containing putative transcriptional regulator [Kribbella sp. NPDC051620]|uniref:AfsR/SARP family transcriptional regulator n=1 Tax=Kribbella sp. NPDC051620 TaxID=3364120 RepID=UPI00378EEA44